MTETTIFDYEGLNVEPLGDRDIKDKVLACPYNLKDEEKEYIVSSYEAGFYRYCLEYVYKKSLNLMREILSCVGETIANKMAYVMDEGLLLGISDIFTLNLANKFGLISKEGRMDIINLAELLQAQNRKLNVGALGKEQTSRYIELCLNNVFNKDYSKFCESYVELVGMLTGDKLIPLSPEYITIVQASDNEKIILVRLLFVLLFEIKKRENILINNFKLLIPALWENLSMSDKIYLSLYLKENNATDIAEEVINDVQDHIKIPDFNTDTSLVRHIIINGQDAISCHFSLNNTRSEISALLNIKDNIYVPAMFSRNFICPSILAYIGSPYGYLDEARNVAREILESISNEKWIYFFKNYFLDSNVLVKIIYHSKTANAWCDLVKTYVGDIEDDIPNEDIKNIIILSKKSDIDGVRKLCNSLYLK